jgi:hypothetical protein
VEGAPRREGSAGDLRTEILALDELEREVHGAVLQLSEIGRRDDVRVLDIGGGDRFALEPRHELDALHVLGVHDLHGERLVHEHVLGAVDTPHRPAPEQHVESVAPTEHASEPRIALGARFGLSRLLVTHRWAACYHPRRSTSLRSNGHHARHFVTSSSRALAMPDDRALMPLLGGAQRAAAIASMTPTPDLVRTRSGMVVGFSTT